MLLLLVFSSLTRMSYNRGESVWQTAGCARGSGTEVISIMWVDGCVVDPEGAFYSAEQMDHSGRDSTTKMTACWCDCSVRRLDTVVSVYLCPDGALQAGGLRAPLLNVGRGAAAVHLVRSQPPLHAVRATNSGRVARLSVQCVCSVHWRFCDSVISKK